MITVIPLGGENLAEAQETTAIMIEAMEADQTPGCQPRKRPLNVDESPSKEVSGEEPGKKRINRDKAGGGRPTFQTEITSVPCSQPTYQPINSRSEPEIVIDIQDTEEKKKHLLNNELRFAKIISNSPIGKEKIEKVRKNWKKNQIIIRFETITVRSMEQLCNLRAIDNVKVKVSQISKEKVCYGVIGPIGTDTAQADVQEALEEQGYTGVGIFRLMKGKGKERVPSVNLKVTFRQENLPATVRL